MAVNRLQAAREWENAARKGSSTEKVYERMANRAKKEAIKDLEQEKNWVQQLAHRVKRHFEDKRIEEERQKQRRKKLERKRRRDLEIIDKARKRGMNI